MKDTFNTITQNYEGLYKDKGSKFISYAYPITHEEEVKNITSELKKTHHNARHHCYAYRLGANGEKYRANDDGEPSGTAGRPILGQLLSNELTNILIVVVRYFGGTLLGVSGLINAYKQATAEVINNSKISIKIIEKNYFLEFEYPLQNFVQKIIKEEELHVISTTYELNCKFIIGIRLNKEEQAVAKFSKIDGLKIELL